MSDIIDLIAGTGARTAALRNNRQQARDNGQLSFEALFEPADAGTFSQAERLAVAVFVAGLHRDEQGVRFYSDLLADVASDSLVASVTWASLTLKSAGPTGSYREAELVVESEPTDDATLPAPVAEVVGDRLAAALEHAHLLVFHPRDARQHHLAALIEAGWSLDDIVTLSQAVAFLSYQLRVAAGLRALDQEAS